MRLLHAADLHISVRDAEYSLSVLDELLELARSRAADVLILAGDTFDSAPDLREMREPVRARLAGDRSFRVVAVAGNHESLRDDGTGSRALDFGADHYASRETLVVNEAGAEFVLVPFADPDLQRGFPGLAEAGALPRIAVCHGSWLPASGFPNEAEDSVLDPALFSAIGCSYVALGHIHLKQQFADPLAVYPGSARVWREGELGPRTAVEADISESGKVVTREHSLVSAGEFRVLEVDPSESPGSDAPAALGPADWVMIRPVGLAESDAEVSSAIDAWKTVLSSRVRRLSEDRSAVLVYSDLRDHPVTERFLAELERAARHHDSALVARARAVGLAAIAGQRGVRAG